MSSLYIFSRSTEDDKLQIHMQRKLVNPTTHRQENCKAAGRAMQQETRTPCFSGSSAPSASVLFPADRFPRCFTELVKKTQTHKQARIVRVAGLWGPASLLTTWGTISAFISFFAKALLQRVIQGAEGMTAWSERWEGRRGAYTEVPGQHCHPSVKAGSCCTREGKGKAAWVAYMFCFHHMPCTGCHGPVLPCPLIPDKLI